MAEDVKNAMGRMSRALRVAKERAHAQFEKVKERAQRFSISSASGPRPSSPTARRPESDTKVEQLMALGFTAAAARHGLRVCNGDIEAASMWLLEESNADEILAAEAQSRLEAGTLARVHGLRTVAELNESTVHLHKWDVVAQRWIVSLQDGSVKSIRPQNLLRLPSSRASFSSPPAHTEATGDASQSGAQFDREELKSLARQMLTDCEADQVLDALSTEELLELVQTLQTDASGGYPRGEETQPAASAANTQATSMSPERGGFQERLEHLELEEARVKSLVEAQSKLAKELEAREEALRLAEERLEQRRAEPPEAVAVKIPFVISDEESPALKAERAELQRLRDEVEATAREMEARQQAAKQQAKNFEERELQLLEEESAQLHAASALKEEEARLEMQRRSLGMLQQALLKGASEAKGPATGVTTEHSLDDETFNQHEETAAGASSGGDDEVWELDWSSAFGETRGTPVPIGDAQREENGADPQQVPARVDTGNS